MSSTVNVTRPRLGVQGLEVTRHTMGARATRGGTFARMTDGILPAPVAALLDVALVSELTVVDGRGRPVTYPLIPLYDGRAIFMTSAVLFSRKLRHIKANPRVCVALTDPVGVPADPFARATIQGDAHVVETDLHAGWEELLPLWRAKEPVIDSFVKKRFGLPLFFERSIIEIAPVRVEYWPGGDTSAPPQVFELEGAA
jgi:general stress protein 26